MRAVPHHLISIVEPNYQFSVGDFLERSDALIPRIAGRKALPVVAGGTAYYIRSLAFGMSSAPPRCDPVRREINRQICSQGLERMYRDLAGVDPEYAESIGPRDRSRIIRAWEVITLTGRPLSDFRVPSALRRRYRFLFLGLSRPREELYARIDKRVDDMFACGLVEEIKGLLSRGHKWVDPGLKGIGYREFGLYCMGCLGLSDLKHLIKRNTRRYAKRQTAFFSALPGVKWHSADNLEPVVEDIERFRSDRDPEMPGLDAASGYM